METRSTISAPPIKCKKNWAMHPPKEMSFQSLRNPWSSRGWQMRRAIHLRKISQQEVLRRGVQVGVRNYSDHNDEVTQHSSHIDPREKYKEKVLELLWSAESIQHKFWHQGIILQLHYLVSDCVLNLYKEKRWTWKGLSTTRHMKVIT